MKVAPPPNLEDLVAAIPVERGMEIVLHPALKADTYLHWDKLRYKKPPKGLTVKEWVGWVSRFCAGLLYKTCPHTVDKSARPFVYVEPVPVRRLLHELDIHIGPGLQSIDQDSELGQYNLINSLIEEAITFKPTGRCFHNAPSRQRGFEAREETGRCLRTD